MRRVVEQLDGVGALGPLGLARSRSVRSSAGQRLVRRRRLELAGEEAGALAGVAGRAGGLDEREQRVAVAVERAARGRACVLPDVAPLCHSSSRERLHRCSSPVSRVLRDRLGVGVGQRQDLARVPVLDDDGHQPALVVGDLHAPSLWRAARGYGAVMPISRMSLAALVAATCLVLAPAAPAAERTKPRTVSVDVAIDKFGMRKGKPVAYATATTVAYTRHGQIRQAQQKTTLAVKNTGSCKILTLHIDDLKLVLLGLTVDTSAVNLNITGNRSASLGKLFCTLAQSLKLQVSAKARAATRGLNRYLQHRKLHTLRFRAAIRPQTYQGDTAQGSTESRQAAPAPSCAVLDLTLGPINLNLLGLLVDLYGPTAKDPVTVTITADPNGGVLGKLFCQLANEAQANSTA